MHLQRVGVQKQLNTLKPEETRASNTGERC